MVRILGRCLPIICMSRKKRQSFPICEQQTNGTKHQHEINKLFVRRVESIRVTHQGIGAKRLTLQTIKDRLPEKKKTKSKEGRTKAERVVRPDDTEFDCETHISDRDSKQKGRTKSKKKPSSASIKGKSKETKSAPSRSPLEKLFKKTKKAKTPSPVSSNAVDIQEEEEEEEDDDDTSSISSTPSSTSDWSSTTYPDSQSSSKSDEETHRRQSMPATCLKSQHHPMKHRSCVENFYLSKELVPPLSTATKIKAKNSPSQLRASAKSKQVLQNVRNMMKDHSVQEQHFKDTRQRESVRL